MTKPKPGKPKPASAAPFKKAHGPALESIAKKLDYSQIDAIHQLQALVVSYLSPDQIHWVRQREKGSISAHMNADMPIIGLMLGNKLIGLALLAFPENPDSTNVNGYPVKDAEKTMIIQSFIVDPAYKGIGQGKKLMALIHAEAAMQGRPYLVARVAVDNVDSKAVFNAAGFELHGKEWFPHAKHPAGGYYANHWEKTVDVKLSPAIKPATRIHRTHKDSRPVLGAQ